MKFMQPMLHILKIIWSSTASIIAIILIIAAFVFGYMVGNPNNPSSEKSTDSVAGVSATEGGDHAEGDGHDHSGEASSEKDVIDYWTCSMHPFIHKDKPGKCPICSMTLIPVKKGVGGSGEEHLLVMSPESIKLAEIETTKVMRLYPEGEVRLVGTIDYDETRLATIAAYFPGRIDRLFVDYTGISVTKGDHLAEIYSPQLLEAQEELKQALETVNNDISSSSMIRSMNKTKLQASRDKLRLWGLSDDQIKGIEETDQVLERLTIYAPLSGVVIHRNAVEGQYLKTGEPIYRIADLSQLWVQMDAYESQLPWLHYGQNVEFTSDSFPGETFYGRISFIDPVLSEKTRTVRVRLEVSNEDGRLKPGMFVHAIARGKMNENGVIFDTEFTGKWISPMHPEIIRDEPGKCPICGMKLVPVEDVGFIRPTEESQPPVVIPVTAALVTGKRAVVYIQVPDKEKPTFEGRVVTLGPRAGDFYIVKKGLSVGEEIVTKGNFKIDSSMQIAAMPSMMSPKGGGGGGGMAGMKGMGGPAKKDQSGSSEVKKMMPTEFLRSLDGVYAEYFDMQQALVKDDLASFTKSYDSMWKAVIAVKADSLMGDAKEQWHEAQMSLAGQSGEPKAVADIDAGRLLFDGISKALIEVNKDIGHLGDHSHYVDFCPMAFGGKGALWLASKSEIENPYLGQEMPGCGEIREEFTPRADTGGSEHGSTTFFDIKKVPSGFVQSLAPVYQHYFEMKQALVNDDFDSFKSNAKAMYSSIDTISTDGLTSDMVKQWDGIKAALTEDGDHIDHLENIDVARKLFESYSGAMINLSHQFGHPDDSAFYVDFCPMAFDGKGALWMSSQEEINNPYLGQDMPGCGEVREVLEPTDSTMNTSKTGGDR